MHGMTATAWKCSYMAKEWKTGKNENNFCMIQLENNLLAIMETTLKKHKAHGVCLCVQVDAILKWKS